MKQYIKNFPSVLYSWGASSRILHRYPNLGRLKWWHVKCQSISINSMDTLCIFVVAAKKGSWIPYVAKDDLPKCKDYRNVSPYPEGFFVVVIIVCLSFEKLLSKVSPNSWVQVILMLKPSEGWNSRHMSPYLETLCPCTKSSLEYSRCLCTTQAT